MVAIIGANGFLGSRLVNSLLQENKRVIAVYNGKINNIESEAILMTTDSFLASDFKPKEIYFVAGSYSYSHLNLIELNNLLSSISKKFTASKIIYISSTNVYGFHTDIISLDSQFNRPTLYALSKIAGEFIVMAHEKYTILRLTYLYGPRLNNKSFLPNLIENSKEKGFITLFGDGERVQDYLYVDDAVSLCKACETLETNEILIGASGISTSNNEVATIISSYHKSEVQHVGSETSLSFRFDISNTLSKVNWTPKVSFKDGLIKTLES